MTSAEGQEIETEGTECKDTVCKCRTRDGYVPTGDGRFCRNVSECVEGEEMLTDGTC